MSSHESISVKGSASISTVSLITTKMINDINMTDTIHKINHQSNPSQMIEQHQSKVHQIPLSEDPRTLQLALELSLAGLSENQNCYTSQHPLPLPMQSDYELSSINVVSAAFARTDMAMKNHPLPLLNTAGNSSGTENGIGHTSGSASGLLMPSLGLEDRSKKSQNMTECVPVPSSEHVAEIVGRQGCKIKALRAKTNTYIKTPVRGEEPVFVVTGRKEDVNKAKKEILSAADHFSLIRASRKPSMEGFNTGANAANGLSSGCGVGGLELTTGSRIQSGPPSLPGQITIQVRVPYRVVGLVVGPKGATIKHIQQETQTYIVTPSREKEPIFEVTGLSDNVETARKQIEAHIALRTGNNSSTNNVQGIENCTESLESNEFTHCTLQTLSQILSDDSININSHMSSSIYKCEMTPGLKFSDNIIDNVTASSASKTHCNHSGISSVPVSVSVSNCLSNSNQVDIEQTTTAGVTDKNFSISPALNETICVAAGSVPLPVSLPVPLPQSKVASMYRNNVSNVMGIGDTSVSNKSQPFCSPTSASGHGSIGVANILTRSCSSASSTASTKSTNNSANSTNSSNTPPELLTIWKNLNESIDVDEGIGDSPSIWNLPTTATIMPQSHCSPTFSISPTDSLLREHSLKNNKDIRPITFGTVISSSIGTCSTNGSSSGPNTSRECYVCNNKEVTTALVPCGHNMFCMDCANQICVSMESICPVCQSIVYQAMRILP
ncbi:RNA-binding protein MEX3B isoform X1 [Drosophila busckii]|nr:RNA-binding protein MEX3B isoform X1 [Drosophila busckii]XP_017853705.1 RNA-binding protein MEX3B isoform X1 [Drosophila busckii]XP_017853706.1 RNA-binding protein MEX3B isoform X1 [Drosophila busckii]